jgi:hypothetical protein
LDWRLLGAGMGTVLPVGLAPPVAGLVPLVMIAAKFAE